MHAVIYDCRLCFTKAVCPAEVHLTFPFVVLFAIEVNSPELSDGLGMTGRPQSDGGVIGLMTATATGSEEGSTDDAFSKGTGLTGPFWTVPLQISHERTYLRMSASIPLQ